MNTLFVPINNQNGGVVIIMAMMMVVILTIMGITSTTTSVVENRIAVNNQLHKMAFHSADSGLYGTAKIISVSIDETDGVDDDAFNFTYGDHLKDPNAGDFYSDIIMGAVAADDIDKVDISFDLDNGLIKADIRHLGTQSEGGAGGGFVFGEGATMPLGGQEMTLYFRIFSKGEAPRSSASTLSAQYRKVLGVPGGL